MSRRFIYPHLLVDQKYINKKSIKKYELQRQHYYRTDQTRRKTLYSRNADDG